MSRSAVPTGPQTRRALEVALDYIATAAFSLGRDGRVLYANQVGRVWLDEGGEEATGRLRRAIGNRTCEFDVHPTHEPGLPDVYLVIARPGDRIEVLADRAGACLR